MAEDVTVPDDVIRSDPKPDTFYFEQVTSPDTVPSLYLVDVQNQGLKRTLALEPDGWKTVSQEIIQHAVGIVVEKPGYSQDRPLFINIKREGKGLTWRVNPDAKPFAYSLENNPAYQQAELSTDGCGLNGLVAATVGTTTERARLYSLMATVISEASTQIRPDALAQRIKAVFLGSGLTPALAIVGVHQRTDLFPGIQIGNNLEIVNQDETAQTTANYWQTKAKEISARVKKGEVISLEEIKFIEVLSHLFKLDRVLSTVASTAVIKTEEGRGEKKEGQISHTAYTPRQREEIQEQQRLIRGLTITVGMYPEHLRSGVIRELEAAKAELERLKKHKYPDRLVVHRYGYDEDE